MSMCIFCGREAIRCTSFTTGCCIDVRKAWALGEVNKAAEQQAVIVEAYEDELTLLRRTLDEVKAPDDEFEGSPRPTSLNRRILLLADQRNQAKQEVKEASDAISFASTDNDVLPARIAGICKSLRHLIAENNEFRKRLEQNPEAEALLNMLSVLANNNRDGWERVLSLYEHFGSNNKAVYKILHHSQARPPGWHGG